MTIDLSPFFDPNHYRGVINAPLSDVEHTYATNGHILIRVPRRDDAPESDFAKRAAEQFEKWAHGTDRRWFDIPELPPRIMKPCDECDHGCACCENGFYEDWQSVKVGECLFNRKYLAAVAGLPNAKISPDGAKGAWFRFDGGDGLLMPMKQEMPRRA